MLEIFLKTLPFFALIGLGYLAVRLHFFTTEATVWLTRFVFYFALSAMLFRFAADLSLAQVYDGRFVIAYLTGTAAVYLLTMTVAFLRGLKLAEAAIESHCAITGNVGFLGLPMMVLLLGPQAVGPNMLVLSLDLIVFGSLVVVLITASREGRLSLRIVQTIGAGLLKNPMIVSILLGLGWAALETPLPRPADEFLKLLAGAATPTALFVIGASLAEKSAERPWIASWLSFAKLVLHPLAVAFSALWLFRVEPFAAGVMIVLAALPVAGNAFILAQHYRVAPQRVSAAILVSTFVSVGTVALIVALVQSR